jgi:ABC-type Zn uptake system ZnuABC Zn-binding protein ZnuA
MHAFTAESLKSIRPLLQSRRICTLPAFVALVLLAVTACTSAQTPGQQDATARGDASLDGLAPLTLPELNGDKLRVVATTSIIGDVVGQVGGDAIDLTVLMGPGQDPHGFEPSAGDLRAAAEADAIFVNGWDLEEGLLEDLRNVSAGIPLVPVSAGIPPLPFSGHDEEGATSRPVADPHSWLDPVNVLQWVENTEHVLLALDGSSATRKMRVPIPMNFRTWPNTTANARTAFQPAGASS